MDDKQLQILLEKYFGGNASAEEKAILFKAIREDETLLNRIVEQLPINFSQTDLVSAESKTQMLEVIFSAGKHATQSSLEPTPRIVPGFRTAWFKYAAAIIILFGISVYLYFNSKKHGSDLLTSNPVPVSDVAAPESVHASITLSNGTIINLADASTGIVATEGNIKVEKLDGGRIVYKGLNNGEIMYNTISVPKGSKTTSVILADGTIVDLNTATTLKYPVAFNGKERRVELDGECYFEVAENKQQPFIVKTYKDSIVVLGTEFNVNAYANETGVKTTLVQGAVKVNQQILKPAQAFLNGEIVGTDVDKDIAWRRGIFQFDHSSIPEVLRQVSRWYDLDIVYKSKTPDVLFSGKLSKELNLSQIIKILNDMQVKCVLEDKKLVIY